MTGQKESVVELSQYIDLIWRRLWVILAVFFATVVITLLVSLKMTPIYEATTTLRIEQRSPKVMTNVNEVTPMGMGDYASYRDYYETQYKLIKSKSLLKRVLDLPSLKSYGTSKEKKGLFFQQIKDFLGISGERPALNERDQVVEKLMRFVKVKPVVNSQLVKISAQDPDPKLVVVIADSMADQYVKQNLERSLIASDTAARWLTNAVEEQRAKLQKAEVAFQKFQEEHNMNLLTQTTGSTSVEDIKSEYVKQQAQYDNFSERYTPEHPKMIELKSQLNSLKGKIDGLKEVDTGNKSVEYRALEGEAQTNRRMYEALLTRFKEIDLSGSLNMNNITIVDRAELPIKPIKPDLKKNLILAVIAGLFGGLGLAYLVDALDRTVKSTEDVKEVLKSHFLGAIHNIGSFGNEVKRDKVAHLELFSPVSEAYRAIRTDILNLIPTNGQPGGKAILVTSAEPRAGKTMTISNLAIVFAQQGYRVLLVDCDLRKPQIHRIYNLGNSKGMGGYLMGQYSLEDVTQNTEVEKLKVITSGEILNNPAEALGSKRMEDFIHKAKEEFNFIFLDSPPVISVTDSVVLADKADASIQVIRSGKSSVHAAVRVKELLLRAKAKVLGVVLNDLNARRGGYGYYYNYKYYHYYGQGHKRRGSNKHSKSTR